MTVLDRRREWEKLSAFRTLIATWCGTRGCVSWWLLLAAQTLKSQSLCLWSSYWDQRRICLLVTPLRSVVTPLWIVATDVSPPLPTEMSPLTSLSRAPDISPQLTCYLLIWQPHVCHHYVSPGGSGMATQLLFTKSKVVFIEHSTN